MPLLKADVWATGEDGRVRVLVVEDEPLIRLNLETIVAEAGHEVVGRAATGEDAVRLAERNQPDLALMDIGLAGAMDGVEVARQLFLRWQIRSLFVSANSESYRANAAAARPLGFLSKPVPALELKAALAAAASELQSR